MGLSIKHIEEALTKNGGFVSRAAKTLGVSPRAIYARIEKSDHLKQVVENVRESYLDLAESKLLGLINDSNLGAICFYLKCLGKKRGYVEALQLKNDAEDEKPVGAVSITFQTIDGSKTRIVDD